jgi:hypothetical protein
MHNPEESQQVSYPRVTEILAWAMPRGFIDEYYLRRGTYIHQACDLLAAGFELTDETMEYARRLRPMPLANHGEVWADYLAAYQQFLAKHVPHTLTKLAHETDIAIVNEVERYRGTPDQVWLMSDGREAVIELKTGTAPKSTRLQTAFYDLGLPSDKRRRRFALQLRPGDFKLIPYTDTRDYDRARLLVRAYHVAQEFV